MVKFQSLAQFSLNYPPYQVIIIIIIIIIYIKAHWPSGRVFANGPEDWGSISG